ncbi:MAG: DUF4936 family protein [Thiobacillus sp.]
MRAVYVYYRIRPDRTADALARASAQMRAMRAFCTLPPRIMQRCNDPSTWMEIYEGIADWTAFASAFDRATAESGLASCLAGERHLECFLSRDTEA